MPAIKNKEDEDRRAILHAFRRATCLQVRIWAICRDVIEEVLVDCDAVARVIQVSGAYAGKQLTDADLDSIFNGLKEMNQYFIFEAMSLSEPIGYRKAMHHMGNLSAAARLTLLKAFENAINMQAELGILASNLAFALDRSLEDIELGICDFAITTNTGMEVDEMDLRGFFGELLPVGVKRVLVVIEPRKSN